MAYEGPSHLDSPSDNDPNIMITFVEANRLYHNKLALSKGMPVFVWMWQGVGICSRAPDRRGAPRRSEGSPEEGDRAERRYISGSTGQD